MFIYDCIIIVTFCLYRTAKLWASKCDIGPHKLIKYYYTNLTIWSLLSGQIFSLSFNWFILELENSIAVYKKSFWIVIHGCRELQNYLQIHMYIYVWKLNQTVLELDLRAVKFLFFPRRDLNSHHWYTAAPFA